MPLDLSTLANADKRKLLGNAVYLLIWLDRWGSPGEPVDGWAPLFAGAPAPWQEAQRALSIGRSRRYEWVRYLQLAGLIRESEGGVVEIAAFLLVKHVSDIPEVRKSGSLESRNPDTSPDGPLPPDPPSPLNPPSIDDGAEKAAAAEADPEMAAVARVERYLAGRVRTATLGGKDLEEVRRWVALAAGDLDAIEAGIDAGLKVFWAKEPGGLPRRAGWYTGYVEKAIERANAARQPAPETVAAGVRASGRRAREPSARRPRNVIVRDHKPDSFYDQFIERLDVPVGGEPP